MRILEVSRYKNNFADHQLPFVTEQGESLRKAGCEVEFFLVKGNYVKAVGALKKKIREFKPDIVHAHFGLSAITAELQGLVPVVTTFHNGETLNWHVNLISSLMSLRAKHVIYVAQHIRDLSYFKARQYSIIPCGVPMEQMTIVPQSEARRQLGWDEKKRYILFGGAFSNERKNYALLRDAVQRLETSSLDAAHLEPCGLRHIVAIRSTVLPGTNERVGQIIEETSGLKRGKDFTIVSNPEFLREGTSVKDYFNPPLTLVGTDMPEAEAVFREIYKGIEAEFIDINQNMLNLIEKK